MPDKFDNSFKLNEEQIAALKRIVPEAFKDGLVDIGALSDALSDYSGDDSLDIDENLYGLYWPGKRAARKAAYTKPKGSLIPIQGEGFAEDTSRNIFIEGDNLETLKVLKKAYEGQIKMIYIDPPYNTGKDFIYNDNLFETVEEFQKRMGQVDENGIKTTTNNRTDGRFHSRWLSMIYPRLILSRTLLREDGVIFVSISDAEIGNLKLLMDDIFGSECFISIFIWNTDGHTDNQLEVKINHEYILCYQKNSDFHALNDILDPSTREESNLHKGFAENSITKNGPKNPASKIILKKGFPCKVKELKLSKSNIPQSFFDEVKALGYISREITNKYHCEYPIRLNELVVSDYKLQNDCEIFAGWANANKLKQFIDTSYAPIFEESGNVSFYISPKGVIYYKRERDSAKNILSVLKNFTTTEKMRSLLENGKIFFSYPKPVDLITYLLRMGLTENDIVLDFFAGSGTTGHALFEFNKINDFSSKFILIQIAEAIQENSLAKQNNYNTIDQVTRDRILFYSKVYQNEGVNNIGFKFYRLRTSNFKPVGPYTGTDIKELSDWFADDPLVDGWKPENLIVEVMLKEGFPLDSAVTQLDSFKKNKVYQVSSDCCGHSLVICLDKNIENDTIEKLDLGELNIFICLDIAVTDQVKARLDDKGQIITI